MSLHAAFLAPGVLERFEALSPRFEGSIPWMYLDIKGYVTVAIGLLIDPIEMALPLPWVRASDGAPATADEIRAEWSRIKADKHLATAGAGEAKKLTTLRLTPVGVHLVTLAALERMLRALVLDFADWEEWPADAQLAVLLLVWAVGTDLPRKWPRLTAALRACDWATAAVESKIREAGNPGVVPRNKEIKRLFEGLAARATTVPAPPPTEPQAEVIPGAAEAHASAQLLDREVLEGWAREGWRERDKGLLIPGGGVNLATPMADEQQDPILKFFAYKNLPPHLQEHSKPWCELAERLVATLPRSAERTVALRKLLEGKDAAVRAALP